MRTEKEKMLAGELYQAFGEELSLERSKARKLVHQFNSLDPELGAERCDIIRELFGSVGDDFYLEQPFRCDYGYNITWGSRSFANFNLTILDVNTVKIGNDVLIGPNVNIFTAGHPLDLETRKAGWEFGHSIEIGDGCWIGGGVTINPGVRIGKNVVIGAGSVVTKDIPDNVVAVGNPCRVIRQLEV